MNQMPNIFIDICATPPKYVICVVDLNFIPCVLFRHNIAILSTIFIYVANINGFACYSDVTIWLYRFRSISIRFFDQQFDLDFIRF